MPSFTGSSCSLRHSLLDRSGICFRFLSRFAGGVDKAYVVRCGDFGFLVELGLVIA